MLEVEGEKEDGPKKKKKKACPLCEYILGDEFVMTDCLGCKNLFHVHCMRLCIDVWEMEDGERKMGCLVRQHKSFTSNALSIPPHLDIAAPEVTAGSRTFNLCDNCCTNRKMEIDYTEWTSAVEKEVTDESVRTHHMAM